LSEYLLRRKNIRLDHNQRIALDEDESRVVLAGPGSGKTYLLTTKVAKLLNENTVRVPQKIACLTYSRLLQSQIQSDLEMLGIVDDERIFVGTVHAFCISEVMLSFKELYRIVLPNPLRIASWPEMLEALTVAMQNQEKEMPTSLWEQGNLMRDLSKYRKLYLDDQYQVYPESKFGYLNLNWLQLASDYKYELFNGENAPSSLDFVEIELLTLQLIQQHRLVQNSLAAKYPWWLIDEYQDLGLPFHKMILCLLDSTDINIFSIGDPNQCIYEEIQGSKPEFIGGLARKVEQRDKNPPIELQLNYRNAQEIIDVSQVVLGEELAYKSGSKTTGQCNLIRLDEPDFKPNLLLRLLNHLVNNSIPLDQIAILSSRRRELSFITTVLEKANFPYSLDKDPEYKQTELTEWIESLAKWCVSGISKPYLSDLLSFWFELNEHYYGNTLNKNEFELTREIFDVLEPMQSQSIKVPTWFNHVANGLHLNLLVERYGDIRPDDLIEFNNLRQAIMEGNRLSQWDLSRFAKLGERIQLTTLHSSKGCQYEAVIISDFDSIPWQQDSIPTHLDHRLMYVALTRAKTLLYLLFENQNAHFVQELRKSASEVPKFFGYANQKAYILR